MAQFPPPVSLIITVATPEEGYHPPNTLADLAQQKLGKTFPIHTVNDPIAALELLRTKLAQTAEQLPLGIITGSLYTAGALLNVLQPEA